MKTYTLGNPDSNTILIQMVDDHDLSFIEEEVAQIRSLTKDTDFQLLAIKTDDWNQDLSPWPAPPVFGNEGFGDGAPSTLSYLLDDLVLSLGKSDPTIFIGGYSLAGLFALWAAYQTDVFSGVAAVSPSVWFPGFRDYVLKNAVKSDAVYLSLGDREEKTRNKTMSQVGDSIRKIHQHLQETGTDCTLEWNPGNHFKDPAGRCAKGFAWLLSQKVSQHQIQ